VDGSLGVGLSDESAAVTHFYARAHLGFSPSTYSHRDALAICVTAPSGAVTWM